MEITETHLSMIKSYCLEKNIEISYTGKKNIYIHGKSMYFILGDTYLSEERSLFINNIESHFLNIGREQDKLLKGKTVSYYSLKDCKWKIKIYGDKLQCASISCKVSKKNKVKTSVDYSDDIFTKENK